MPLMLHLALVLLAPLAAAVPHFFVDLDEEPEERWRDVVLHYMNIGAIDAMTKWNPKAPHASLEAEDAWLAVAEAQLDEEYNREIDGWLKYAAGTNISRRAMLLSAVTYEMNSPHFCSGVVAAMPNGTVVHGRNMDYELEIELMGKPAGWSELTVDVTFLRAGKPLMTSVTWPGQLGIHTGMRLDGWTFEQNTRHRGTDVMERNLAAARQGATASNGLLVRRVMERVPDFEGALQELWSAKLAAPMYFVLTGKGPYEAAVLTMDRGGVHEVSSPPLMRLSEADGVWKLLQTNDDYAGVPHDARRFREQLKLDSAEQSQVSVDWVFSEMRGVPLKIHSTVFTWIAVPATGFHQTVLPSEPDSQLLVGDIDGTALSKTFLPPRRPVH